MENNTTTANITSGYIQELKAKKNDGPCESCGYCQHCGRGGHQTIPYYFYYPHPNYQPYWLQTGGGGGTNGGTNWQVTCSDTKL